MPHFFYVLTKRRQANSFAEGGSATVKIGDTTSDDPELKKRIRSINNTSRKWYDKKPSDPRASKNGWIVSRVIRISARKTAAALALGVQARAAASGKLHFVKQRSSCGLRCTDYISAVDKEEMKSWIEAEMKVLKRFNTATIRDEPINTAQV